MVKKSIMHWAWIGAMLFGLGLIGAGAFMVSQGQSAHNQVRDALSAEMIVTPADSALPNTPVTGAAQAKAQADVIWKHVLTQTGGKTYAQLDQADPLRATYLQSVTLRTALMESYLAFKVADLVTGVGVIVALLGASQVVLGGFLGLMARANAEPPRLHSRRGPLPPLESIHTTSSWLSSRCSVPPGIPPSISLEIPKDER